MIFIRYFGLVLFLIYEHDSLKVKPLSPEWYAKVQEFIEASEPENDIEVPPLSYDRVQFYLFNKENKTNPVNLTFNNLNLITENADELFVLIHGWLESREQQWYEDLKNAIFEHHSNANVIQVDYSDPAFDFYIKSMASAKYVGKIVGEFLIQIHDKRKVSTKNMILLPHSLGSHVAGYAAKTVKRTLPRIARIIAMDPAGPRWDNKPCDKRLCKTDADAVVVIHTDAGGLGYAAPLGTIDFYANGGYNQTGCQNYSKEVSVDADCDHCRSWAYLIEAMEYPNHFMSKRCEGWETYEEHQDKCDPVVITLGNLTTKEQGTFFFKTHDKFPFAIEGFSSSAQLSSTNTLWIILCFIYFYHLY